MVRLHEIELGSADPLAGNAFYQTILGLQPTVEQEGLTVFRSGNEGVDFNLSNHLPPKTALISFLTDDLEPVMRQLTAMSVTFNGPRPSHLGMCTIEFNDLDGNRIRVNMPTAESPERLQKGNP